MTQPALTVTSATQKVSPQLAALLASLRPGQRLKITQRVRVGARVWPATATGVFRRLDYLATGLSTERVPEDDIVVPTLTIPVNRPILLTLRAKDVNHAFYVPELRIQQDFVPGLAIPLHFTAVQTGKFENVCTLLCWLGHYNMRAYVEVMSQEQFDQWLKERAAEQ